jgi:hypothetical protein
MLLMVVAIFALCSGSLFFTYFGTGCVDSFFMDFDSSVIVLDGTEMSAASSSKEFGKILLISYLS